MARSSRPAPLRPLGQTLRLDPKSGAIPVARREAPPREPLMSLTDEVEPAVLVVGAGQKMLEALKHALARHRVFVETASIAGVVDAVVAAAPDLILLVGDAARDCGSTVLRQLAGSPVSSVVPVAIVDDDKQLDARLRAFRHGAAAVIPRSASVDAIATQVARLAREIPERGNESLGNMGESTLEEFVSALSTQLRSGILSVKAGSGDAEEEIRLVFGQGRPLAEFIDDFVTRVRRHVVMAEPIHYEFDERAGGTVQLLGAGPGDAEAAHADIQGLRVVLADDDSARADAVAQQLREEGATVVVTDLEPNENRFARLRSLDPAVLLIGEAHVQGEGYELVRRMRRDTRLRWASLLVVRWDQIWTELAPAGVGRILGTLAALMDAERSIVERARAGIPFDSRLESCGPARLLRGLADVESSMRLSVFNPRVRVDVDLSEGLIVGASGHTLGPAPRELEAASALSALLVVGSGRVHIEHVENPATANLMSTIDVALNMADAEPAPIPPSLPSPPTTAGQSNIPPPLSQAPPALDDELGLEGSFLERHPAPPGLPLVAIFAIGLVQVLVLVAGVMGGRAAFAQDNKAAPASQSSVAAAKPTATSPAAPVASAAPAPALPTPAPTASAAPAEANALATPEQVDGGASSAPGMLVLETNKQAPTCDELLNGEKTESARAAVEQLRIARRALIRGDLDDAQRCFCRAVRWDPDNEDAMGNLARLMLLRRDGKAAAEWANKAVKLHPSDTTARALLGDALAQMGKREEAREAWLAAYNVARSDTKQVRSVSRRELAVAQAALKARGYDRAERFFRRAAVLNPDDAEAAAGLARTLLLMHDSAGAVSWAKHAAEKAPRSSTVFVLLGDALWDLGKNSEAERAYRQAQSIDPRNREATHRLGRFK